MMKAVCSATLRDRYDHMEAVIPEVRLPFRCVVPNLQEHEGTGDPGDGTPWTRGCAQALPCGLESARSSLHSPMKAPSPVS